MNTIAINQKEDIRLLHDGKRYILQEYSEVVLKGWITIKSAEEEWIASKWVIDYSLKTDKDYPPLQELLEGEKNEEEHETIIDNRRIPDLIIEDN